MTTKHDCEKRHPSYFSPSKIRVLGSGCTEMSTYQSPFGMTVSRSMK
jgi:hypothetical protein